MKILITQKIAGISGSELYIKTLLLELNKRNIVADFLAIEPIGSAQLNDNFINEILENGIKVFRVPYHGPFSLNLYYRICKIIKNGAYDILQTNLLHADIIVSLIKVFYFGRFKIISIKHGYDEKFLNEYGLNIDKVKRNGYYYITKFVSKVSDITITVSSSLTKFIIGTDMVSSQKVVTIPLGFNFSHIKFSSSINDYRFSENQLIIVGRLAPVKQHNLVIEILPDIIREFQDLKLVIVGDGSHRETLEKLCESYNVTNHVVFTGFSTNIHNYLKCSNLEILPSSAEGFGIVILEAWHSEVPVIAFDVPAPNEIITDGEDGYLIPPFDKEIMKEKIIYLLRNKDIAKNMGKAGKKKLETQYTMEIMLSRTIAMYNNVLNKV